MYRTIFSTKFEEEKNGVSRTIFSQKCVNRKRKTVFSACHELFNPMQLGNQYVSYYCFQ